MDETNDEEKIQRFNDEKIQRLKKLLENNKS